MQMTGLDENAILNLLYKIETSKKLVLHMDHVYMQILETVILVKKNLSYVENNLAHLMEHVPEQIDQKNWRIFD